MALIQNPTIGRKLQRSLRLTELPDSVLAVETVPVILVEDLSAPLSDEDRGCAGNARVGPVAAEFPFVGLRKTSEQYDLVLKRIWVSSNASGSFIVTRPAAAVAGFVTTTDTGFTDAQTPGRPSSQVITDTGVALIAGIEFYRFPVIVDENIIIDLDMRVSGIGDSILVQNLTVNTFMNVAFDWVESSPLG